MNMRVFNIGAKVFVEELMMTNYIGSGPSVYGGVLTIRSISNFGDKAYFSFVETEGWAWDYLCKTFEEVTQKLQNKIFERDLLKDFLNKPLNASQKIQLQEDIQTLNHEIQIQQHLIKQLQPEKSIMKSIARHGRLLDI